MPHPPARIRGARLSGGWGRQRWAKITTDGTLCNSVPAPRNMEAVFPSTKHEPDGTVIVINPAAMKPGSMLVIGLIEPGAGVVAFGLAWEDKLLCSKPRR
ncbi:hypothetical protein Q2K19_22000 [Micromonospora soli]|uniref:hypothetical protein n=1 Tax=Micromonospora sp. NBRC 110009 TaxID=3061627 RepID=UPI002672B6C8|nr:hypothetical protein [Micromonospora sp. NBRC 110009]WKT96852.1 hypothetical protein Q2K19_22000 [Micromonospora sp. NBRC 110009]